MKNKRRLSVKLFYSYSHKDQRFREDMEESLALLRDQDGILDDWSDRRILAGESISSKIKVRFQMTDIFVFLVSRNFISSDACRDEGTGRASLNEKVPQSSWFL